MLFGMQGFGAIWMLFGMQICPICMLFGMQPCMLFDMQISDFRVQQGRQVRIVICPPLVRGRHAVMAFEPCPRPSISRAVCASER
jgi:hypothetical protein